MDTLPDGPATPAILQVIDWIKDPYGALDALARRYGDAFTCRWPGMAAPIVFMSDPAMIKEVWETSPKMFVTEKAMANLRPVLGDASIAVVGHEKHLRLRKLLGPPMHGPCLDAYAAVAQRATDRIMASCRPGEVVSAQSLMQRIAHRVMLDIIFGLDDGARFERVALCTRELMSLFDSPLRASMLFFEALQKDLGPWSPWGKVLLARRRLNEVIDEELAERRRSGEPRRDMLSRLMAVRDEGGQALSDEELRDAVVALMVGSFETTSGLFGWLSYLIYTKPEVRAKLGEEIAATSPSEGPMALARLPYLTAVFKEAIRINPIGSMTFPRVLREETKIGRYTLPAGTIVIIAQYLAHRREASFAEPERFLPERFLGREVSRFEHLPFGGGDRRCPGADLATMETKVVMATLLSRWEIEIAESTKLRRERRFLMVSPGRIDLRILGQRVARAAA